MADINKLITELTDNPGTYAALSDVEVADLGNTVDQTRPRTSMTSTEVWQSIDVAELRALADGDRALVMAVLQFQSIDPFGNEATLFMALFPDGGVTLTALIAARQETVSLFVKLGIGFVIPRNVADARRNM